MSPSAPATYRPEPLIGTAELRRRLGVSKATVFRLIRTGELVPIRIDSKLRFDPEEVRQFVAARRGRKDVTNARPATGGKGDKEDVVRVASDGTD